MEQMLKQILDELKGIKENQIQTNQRLDKLEKGQTTLEIGQTKLEQGQQEIKRELRYMWDDIKRLDSRLAKQEKETALLTRLK